MAFTNATDATRYALAGNAVLTMQSERTGAHYTFHIERATDGRPIYFVSLLTGPDNQGDFSYIGVIREGAFKTTAKTKLPEDSRPIVSFKWIWGWLTKRDQLPPQCIIRHEGRCGRCNRQLTTPISIDRGIGPECAKQMGLIPEPKARKTRAEIPMRSDGYQAGPAWMA